MILIEALRYLLFSILEPNSPSAKPMINPSCTLLINIPMTNPKRITKKNAIVPLVWSGFLSAIKTPFFYSTR
jgi:hypothetical protein